LLEHWISSELLGLHEFGPADIYVDVAAASSPWARILRDRLGINAFAIDLGPIPDEYSGCEYYRQEDATRTSFQNGSVRGISLHCAYEMFMKDDDIRLMAEISRILRPGGRAVILPLYMHTHYCAYSSPEYFGKSYSDPDAREYIHIDCWGIPSSRKYDAINLKSRVFDAIERDGMKYRLRILRNKNDFGKKVYCHFILEIEK
jgi:SAM-dependent methyltransferase